MLPPRQNCQTWIYITPKVRWTEWHKEGMTGELAKETKDILNYQYWHNTKNRMYFEKANCCQHF